MRNEEVSETVFQAKHKDMKFNTEDSNDKFGKSKGENYNSDDFQKKIKFPHYSICKRTNQLKMDYYFKGKPL